MRAEQPAVGFISLGCPKALVDSERILTQINADGYAITDRYDDADLVIVNTCGFINEAVAESLNTISEALRQNGKVIVTGCLGVKPEIIRARCPDVLAITGPQAYESVMSAVHEHLPKPAHNPYLDLIPPAGLKLTPRHYAYLKIAEGCDHHCTFCIIPDLRGRLVSRPADAVLKEAQNLVKLGVKELLVVSQDTSAYGADLGARGIHALARELGKLDAWVRLHYVYPYPDVDDLIPLMADGAILPYLDIPLQHASPRILKAMRRPGNRERRSASAAGAKFAPTWRYAAPSSSASPARPKRTSKNCSPSSKKPTSTAPAASPTRRSKVRRQTPCPTKFPKT